MQSYSNERCSNRYEPKWSYLEQLGAIRYDVKNFMGGGVKDSVTTLCKSMTSGNGVKIIQWVSRDSVRTINIVLKSIIWAHV